MLPYNVELDGKTVLVTGAAGFIGSNLVRRLFHDFRNIKVIGIDSITDYYDVNIKYERLKEIESLNRDWIFVRASIADKDVVERIFSETQISVVVNLAAQAGVRYSITNPDAYIQSNLIGFYNILEACRHHEVEHLVYEGVVRIMQHAPEKQNGEDELPIPPYKVYNIGNNSPENLLDFVTILQEELIAAKVLPADYDFEAHKKLVSMQPGDVPVTYADTTPLEEDFGFKPSTSLRDGLGTFAQWYAKYYGTNEK